jgi:hypothetical protein
MQGINALPGILLSNLIGRKIIIGDYPINCSAKNMKQVHKKKGG